MRSSINSQWGVRCEGLPAKGAERFICAQMLMFKESSHNKAQADSVGWSLQMDGKTLKAMLRIVAVEPKAVSSCQKGTIFCFIPFLYSLYIIFWHFSMHKIFTEILSKSTPTPTHFPEPAFRAGSFTNDPSLCLISLSLWRKWDSPPLVVCVCVYWVYTGMCRWEGMWKEQDCTLSLQSFL